MSQANKLRGPGDFDERGCAWPLRVRGRTPERRAFEAAMKAVEKMYDDEGMKSGAEAFDRRWDALLTNAAKEPE